MVLSKKYVPSASSVKNRLASMSHDFGPLLLSMLFSILFGSVKNPQTHFSSWTNSSSFCIAFDQDADSEDKHKEQCHRYHKQYNDH